MASFAKKFVEKYNDWSQKASAFIRLGSTRSGFRKTASVIWAFLFGLILSFLFIWMNSGQDPFSVIGSLAQSVGNSQKDQAKFLTFFVIFGFIGLASAVGFKSGLFNIGISGQMMIASTVIFPILIATDTSVVTGGLLVPFLFMSMIAGAVLASIAGALKAYLNIHEVISTIMLNWIVAKLNSFLLGTSVHLYSEDKINKYLEISHNGGINPNAFTLLDSSGNVSDVVPYIYGISFTVIFILLGIGLFFMYRSTNIGYKLKMLGLSKTNGQYIGINEKLSTVLVMALSGALAGLGGFFYFVFTDNLADTLGAGSRSPLAIGFEGIAIALIALNSSLGTILVAAFYGALYFVQPSLQGVGVSKEDFPFITSLILYLVALSQLFIEFKPVHSVTKWISNISSRLWVLNLKRYFLIRYRLLLIKCYNMKKAKINATINDQNKDKKIAQYHTSKQKTYIKVASIDAKIEHYNELIKLATVLQQQKADLHYNNLVLARLSKKLTKIVNQNTKNIAYNEKLAQKTSAQQNSNQELALREIKSEAEIKELQNLITELKARLADKKGLYQEILADYKTNKVPAAQKAYQADVAKIKNLVLTFDDAQFKVEATSKAQRIRQAKQEFKKVQNEYLLKISSNTKLVEKQQKAMKKGVQLDRKVESLTNREIIDVFEKVTLERKSFNQYVNSLDGNQVREIKMQYRANKLKEKKEFKEFSRTNYSFIKENYLREVYSKHSNARKVEVCL
ncbi:ABC transporter permease [Mycoplasmopsis columbinasalis]|uniref:ABC-type uncharacterized transport system, permease component n=1 Tax=Mycoplasmopsis columbinasalis TaxID=114880 RepID=A0A449BA30_9BACT|nr:ABC transporter permease [Mycoplasmopsis columbinasalis]VEU78015.1 ABC-type uncharacterized transport system, permease component [Mycoplasmopsis columbinasalis]